VLLRFIIKDQMCAGYGMVNIVAECVGHKAPHGSVSSKICLVFKPPTQLYFSVICADVDITTFVRSDIITIT